MPSSELLKALVTCNYEVSEESCCPPPEPGKTRDLGTIPGLHNPFPVFRKCPPPPLSPPFWLFTACFFHVRVAAAVPNKLELIFFHDGGFQRTKGVLFQIIPRSAAQILSKNRHRLSPACSSMQQEAGDKSRLCCNWNRASAVLQEKGGQDGDEAHAGV